jgi:hypothetical protein
MIGAWSTICRSTAAQAALAFAPPRYCPVQRPRIEACGGMMAYASASMTRRNPAVRVGQRSRAAVYPIPAALTEPHDLGKRSLEGGAVAGLVVGQSASDVRYERRADFLTAFLQLACTLICARRLHPL